MIQFEVNPIQNSMLLVVGVGGGGNNAVNYMHKQDLKGVKFLICNTDLQVLDKSNVENKLQLGPTLTKGYGAGFNPKIGAEATLESKQELIDILQENTKMVFIAAGMGGGTGTGGAPIVAQLCRELGILTVAVVTTPFSYEGKQRIVCAQAGIKELKKYVDIIIIVNNDKIRQHFGSLTMSQAFAKVDDVVSGAIKAITNIIYSTGTINVDFADVCTVLRNGGVAIMGIAKAGGKNRAMQVVEEALNSPLLNDTDIYGAKQILLNIVTSTGEHELNLDENEVIQKQILDKVGTEANLILGYAHDESLNDEISLTLIITGFVDDVNGAGVNNFIDKAPITHRSVNVDFKNSTTALNTTTQQQFSNPNDPQSQQQNKFKPNISNNTSTAIKHSYQDYATTKREDLKYNPITETETNELILESKEIKANNNETKTDREKSFEAYTYEQTKNAYNSQIFIDKPDSEINFSLKPNESINNYEANSFKLNKDKDNKVEITTNNEYKGIYTIKRAD